MPLKSNKADLIRVKHMIDTINEALAFVSGKSRDGLDRDRQLTLSLIKEIEILGEAASRVSEAFRKKHPEIPWAVIVSTRNRLIHGYFDINLDIVWNTVFLEFKPLLKKLSKIIKDNG